jgi:hypothetical protein
MWNNIILWLGVGVIAVLCLRSLVRMVRDYYDQERKASRDLNITWGGDGQRDKVVHRDARGWVTRRLVILSTEELPSAAERVECAFVSGALTDWPWAIQMCSEAIPELKGCEDGKHCLKLAMAIVVQSAEAHGDKAMAAQFRRGMLSLREAVFQRRTPEGIRPPMAW